MRPITPKMAFYKKIQYNFITLQLKWYNFELKLLRRFGLWMHMRRLNKELLNGDMALKPRGITHVAEKKDKK